MKIEVDEGIFVCVDSKRLIKDSHDLDYREVIEDYLNNNNKYALNYVKCIESSNKNKEYEYKFKDKDWYKYLKHCVNQTLIEVKYYDDYKDWGVKYHGWCK